MQVQLKFFMLVLTLSSSTPTEPPQTMGMSVADWVETKPPTANLTG